MINYFIAFIAGCCISEFFRPKVKFDIKSKEMYLIYDGTKHYLTRIKIGYGNEFYIDNVRQNTRSGYIFGLPHRSSTACSLCFQSIYGKREFDIQERDILVDKIKEMM